MNAIYISDYNSKDEQAELETIREQLGQNWKVELVKYDRTRPAVAIGEIETKGWRSDLVIGYGLGGYLALAAQCQVDKIAINPCWNPDEYLRPMGVCVPDAHMWSSFQSWLWKKQSGRIRCIFGNAESLECVNNFKLAFGESSIEIMEDQLATASECAAKISEIVEK